MDERSRRYLPTGIQTFREIRQTGCYYVDKTAYALRLSAPGGKHWFLSRPRRFGKSLFVDTLKELFEGSRELFSGLAVHDEWDWSVRHPVLRLDFSQSEFRRPGKLQWDVMDQLAAIERATGLPAGHQESAGIRCRNLIQALHESTGQKVVFLVDEYDNPILDALDEPEVATANRDYLRDLYGTLKFSEAHIRLSFITGVSKFSKVTLFSGVNQLEDITLDPAFAGICGYTDEDLTTVFAPEFDPALKPRLKRKDIRDWYNGYCWRGRERLYNPVSILRLFRRREYGNWWYETGTPKFLVETLSAERKQPVDLDRMVASDAVLSTFDIGAVSTQALLFQSGYLTIAEEAKSVRGNRYRLGYPNREVRQSLNEHLLRLLAVQPDELAEQGDKLHDLLETGDLDGLEALFQALYAGIPHQWHTDRDMARHEGWYASVFYICFAVSGLDVRPEDSGSAGRADMVVLHEGTAWVFEFKVVELAGEGAALAQLRDRDYAAKYRDKWRIREIGVEFSRKKRSLVRFDAA